MKLFKRLHLFLVCFVFISFGFVTACGSKNASHPHHKTITGLASWYGKPFHGRKMANGQRYNMNKMTAAHRQLPFGTRVRVTNLANQKSVVVKITDRGPYNKSRVIDLSRKAARKLKFIQKGVTRVRVEILD